MVNENNNIYKKYHFDSLKVSMNKAQNFLYNNIRGIITNDKSKFKYDLFPKVSAIIPVYNSQYFIQRTIKSIQNQNILNIEIILINDCSTDKTLSIIKKKKIQDSRIKIINNKKNMGILYSRSIGALSARGKYIFSIDNDDMFLDKDIFSTITNISIEGNFDIVEFRGILSLEGDYILTNETRDIFFTNNNLNMVIFQPKLSEYPITARIERDGYRLISVYLWNKCIKTNIYQLALNRLGKENYSRFMLAHEDVIAMFILFNTANSYKYVGKYGIFHIKRKKSAFSLTSQIQNYLKELYLAEVIIDFAKDISEHKKLIIISINRLINYNILDKIIKINITYKNIILKCLNKYLKSKYISNETKEKIVKRIKIINNIKTVNIRIK